MVRFMYDLDPAPTKKKTARSILVAELERRCRQNPKYSLRAFARALGLNPAMLSQVLSGKRYLSQKRAAQLAQKLGLHPKLSAQFVNTATSPKLSYVIKENYRDLALDQFGLIADWYHFGILSLIETEDFEPRISWISSRLGISEMEAKLAVERLERLGILDTKKTPWVQKDGPIMIENTISTAATRQFQSQLLKMAEYSLENDSAQIRDFSSVTLAIHPDDLPIAAEEIRKFRLHLMSLLEKRKSRKEVYQLAVQLYPASRRKN
jgi:uncharacterized protein (TIGR02147 family)